jgi:hypothetical protein
MENGAIDQTKKLINKMGDISLRGQGRVSKNLGGSMNTARRDMTHGYYKPDMGMQGGQMFRGGGVVKKRGSIGVALKDGGKADKNWIQKAVNPKHKGYCTPMSKKTCTPRRKALARTFKKMGKARKA